MAGRHCFLLATVLLLAVVRGTHAADFLAVFPFPVRSHHNFFQPVIRGLADRGHKVTYVTSVPMAKDHPNVKQIFIETVMEASKHYIAISNTTYLNPLNFWTPVLIRDISYNALEKTFADPNVKSLIESEGLHFDAVLLDTTMSQEPLIAFHHKFNAIAIDLVTSGNFHWAFWLHGNPYDPSYIVDSTSLFSDKMSFFERTLNTVHSAMMRFVYHFCYAPKFQRLMDNGMRYDGWESRPPMMEMMSNVSLVLQNSHVALNNPYPLAPNFKDVGGLYLTNNTEPLPQDVKSFMDGAAHGVIYFSIGSHLEPNLVLGDRGQNVLNKVFSRIPQRVLLKWGSQYKDPPNNVLVRTWFPQSAVFGHKKVKLFITHCGYLSFTEAVYSGVPMVGMPFIGDQMKNVRMMENKGMGVRLNPNNLTEESLFWAISEVITNTGYKENTLKQSVLLKDNPSHPLETAMFWIEYVLRHRGAPHLRPAVASMPWYQQAMLDVVAALVVALIIPLCLVYKLFKCLLGCILCRKKKSKNNKKKIN